MVAKFSLTRRLVPGAEAVNALLARRVLMATDLHRAGTTHGDDDESVERQKRAWNITQPINYDIMQDAIDLSRFAARRLDEWIAAARQGHGEERVNLLKEALDFVRQSEHDFNTSTFACWLGEVAQRLESLIEEIQGSRRRQAMVGTLRAASMN